ncbi:MAG: pyruvate ferredoxin oxidoreductase [Spirochaetes bacterium]|nr:pyruvate ferredoxin oxidoreductase [Spirochaetota bacterium]
MKKFMSGNEAIAHAVKLSRPHVIASYPITPQTVVVERLSEMHEKGEIKGEFINVESEHSAMSALIGASALGARTFTATSSQGLLYMAECLHYASGGRFPIVMMNANRSIALPWNIYGDQRDSLSLLDSGWIQFYAENAQESFDMVIQSFALAENPEVMTPVMINLDGFVLTHTYEIVDVPEPDLVDEFLPEYKTENKMSYESPKNMGFSSTPADNMEFKYVQNKAMLKSKSLIKEIDDKFGLIFCRKYGSLIEKYKSDDAQYIVITLGSVSGTVRETVDQLRSEGIKAGMIRIRFMRPFPDEEIRDALKNASAFAVLEKDISFGYEGTVFTNVASSLFSTGNNIKALNYIGGLGGRNISVDDIRSIFSALESDAAYQRVNFLNLGVRDE